MSSSLVQSLPTALTPYPYLLTHSLTFDEGEVTSTDRRESVTNCEASILSQYMKMLKRGKYLAAK